MSCLVAIGIVRPKRNISLWAKAGQGKVARVTLLSSEPGGVEEVRCSEGHTTAAASANQLDITERKIGIQSGISRDEKLFWREN